MELITGVLRILLVVCFVGVVGADTIPIPPFSKLRRYYPGYKHHSGRYNNHRLLSMIQVTLNSDESQHDTSALRLSYTLNQIGGEHSLGRDVIRLSKFGTDSVVGRDGLQYIYHPLAYGPYLADKYGYPTVSKLHLFDPLQTMKNFIGKQGLLRVITYTHHDHQPKGHVALWNCDHFYQSKDWIAGYGLISVEFWESPDSDCTPQPEKLPESPEDLMAILKRKHRNFRPTSEDRKYRHQ